MLFPLEAVQLPPRWWSGIDAEEAATSLERAGVNFVLFCLESLARTRLAGSPCPEHTPLVVFASSACGYVLLFWLLQEEFDEDLVHIEEAFKPLVLKCKELGRAMRIGTNHGSLSARVLSFYGDTPRGMVESAVEFANICRCARLAHVSEPAFLTRTSF